MQPNPGTSNRFVVSSLIWDLLPFRSALKLATALFGPERYVSRLAARTDVDIGELARQGRLDVLEDLFETRRLALEDFPRIAADAFVAARIEPIAWALERVNAMAPNENEDFNILDAIFATFGVPEKEATHPPPYKHSCSFINTDVRSTPVSVAGWRDTDITIDLDSLFDLRGYAEWVRASEDYGTSARMGEDGAACSYIRFANYLYMNNFDPNLADWYLDLFSYKPDDFNEEMLAVFESVAIAEPSEAAREWILKHVVM